MTSVTTIRRCLPVAFVVYVVTTCLAAIPALTVGTTAAVGIGPWEVPGVPLGANGGARLVDAALSLDHARWTVALSGIVVAALALLASPLLQVLWVSAASDRPATLRTAFRHYAPAAVVALVGWTGAVVLTAGAWGLCVLLAAPLGDGTTDRAQDLVRLAVIPLGLLAALAAATYTDAARALLVVRESGLGTTLVLALRHVRPRILVRSAFYRCVEITLAAAAVAAAAGTPHQTTAWSISALALGQIIAFASFQPRALWLHSLLCDSDIFDPF